MGLNSLPAKSFRFSFQLHINNLAQTWSEVVTRRAEVKKLEDLEQRLSAQVTALQMQLEGVRMSIRALSGETEKARATRPNVKQLLLRLLEEAGSDGLNAAIAVEAAAKQGEQVERATISSLLSRLKADNAVIYDGSVYRLTKFQQPHPHTSVAQQAH